MEEDISQQAETTKRPLKEQAISFIINGIVWGWTIGFIMTCVLPVYQQALSWLKTGVVPPRDLYWFFADVSCAATNWQAEGFEGMELCRPDYIEFTDWVGVDQILNWFYDLHVGIVFLAASFLLYSVIAAITED